MHWSPSNHSSSLKNRYFKKEVFTFISSELLVNRHFFKIILMFLWTYVFSQILPLTACLILSVTHQIYFSDLILDPGFLCHIFINTIPFSMWHSFYDV